MTKKKAPPIRLAIDFEHYGDGSQHRQPAAPILCPHCSAAYHWTEEKAAYADCITGGKGFKLLCGDCTKTFEIEIRYIEPIPSFAVEIKPLKGQRVLQVILQATFLAQRIGSAITFENAGYRFFILDGDDFETIYADYLRFSDEDFILGGLPIRFVDRDTDHAKLGQI